MSNLHDEFAEISDLAFAPINLYEDLRTNCYNCDTSILREEVYCTMDDLDFCSANCFGEVYYAGDFNDL